MQGGLDFSLLVTGCPSLNNTKKKLMKRTGHILRQEGLRALLTILQGCMVSRTQQGQKKLQTTYATCPDGHIQK